MARNSAKAPPRRARKTALVIVHLSSLDAFTQMEHELTGESLVAEDLAFWIERAVMEHDGPVYIVDQGWELHPDWSGPRKSILDVVRFRKDITWISFDEDRDDWGPFLRGLVSRLKANGVTNVIVGGIWFERRLKGGCATEVYLHLKKHFKAKIGRDIVGCESDLKERKEEGYWGFEPMGPV